MYNTSYKLCLTLFGTEAQGTGVKGDAAGSPGSKPTVIYGKQDDESAEAKSSGENESEDNRITEDRSLATTMSQDATKGESTDTTDPDAEFEKLIKGQYKDAFGKRVKAIIDKRVQENGSLAKYKQETGELLELLSKKYGTEVGDTSALTKKILSDEKFFEDAADAEGLTVEQYVYKTRLEAENERLKMREQKEREEARARERMSAWDREAKETSQLYPSFSLERESQNPKFVQLLRSGIDVRTAYEVLHNDEIISGAMRAAAHIGEKRVTDNIRARGTRPAENGAAKASAVVFKSDVSKLTREDRAEIARRARLGEKIKF